MYINLTGGHAVMPEHLKAHHGGGYAHGYGGGQGQIHGGQQQQYQGAQTYPAMGGPQGGYGGQQGQYQGGGQQQYHGGQQQQQQQQDPNAAIEAEIEKDLPGILRALQKCCVVM